VIEMSWEDILKWGPLELDEWRKRRPSTRPSGQWTRDWEYFEKNYDGEKQRELTESEFEEYGNWYDAVLDHKAEVKRKTKKEKALKEEKFKLEKLMIQAQKLDMDISWIDPSKYSIDEGDITGGNEKLRDEIESLQSRIDSVKRSRVESQPEVTRRVKPKRGQRRGGPRLGKSIKKGIYGDIEDIISLIEEQIATDAQNNSGMVPYLEAAVRELQNSIRRN
jgi:hypothetical protein